MRKWLPLLAVSLSTFMLLVDLTIVTIAAPDLATELHSSFSALQWTVDLYVLVLAALLMAAGSTADRLGHRRVFIGGLVVFALASLACGLAPDTGTLIAARGVQGAGAAAMYATNAALLGLAYTGRDRSIAFGIWGAANGAAAAAGPIIGGLLTEHVGWRSIFLVNLPVAVLAVILARVAVPGGPGSGTARLDLPGVATFTTSVSFLVYGLIRAGDAGWRDTVTLTALAAGALAAALFVLVERGRPNPMLDLALFHRPAFTALMLGAAALTASAFANFVFMSLWAQQVLGLGAMDAGLVLAPMAVVAFVVAAFAGRLLHAVAPRHTIGWGLILVGAGNALYTLVDAGSGWKALVPGLCVVGVGVGLSTPVLASAVLGVVPPERVGMANGASNTFRQLGYALALPVLAAVLTARVRAVSAAGGSAASAYAHGLDRIFLISAVLAAIGGVAVLTLLRPAPRPAEAQASRV
ncbi:MFS transporter [Actinoplanes sp. HUAS TT8]|uniref:MFS transporter n=1 Tax=Actinoplanes sp. HUAS TT8 TaxID=3447453 RepID=UPI003F524050